MLVGEPQYDTHEAEQVAGLLVAEGYTVYPYDPNTNKGVGPDLVASKDDETLWVEVKATAPEGYLAAYDLAHEYFADRYAKSLPPFSLDLYVASGASHGDYKFLGDLAASQNDPTEFFVALAIGYSRHDLAHYSLETDNGAFAILAALGGDPFLLAPWQLGHPVWGQEVKVRRGDSVEVVPLTRWADQIFVGARCRRRQRDGGIAMISSATGMQRSTAMERLRGDVKKANRQIKRVCRDHFEAPGLVFLVPQNLGVDQDTLLAALFGDPTISFAPDDTESSQAFYGRNGVYRPDQQTHISACYLLGRKEMYFARNPFAARPIDNILPQAKVVGVDVDPQRQSP